MFKNKKVFGRIMAVLRAVNPDVPFPEGFDGFLFDAMKVRPYFEAMAELEAEGTEHGNAYFVDTGLVLVLGYEDGLPFLKSIYRPDTIVALYCFLKQQTSEFSVMAVRGTRVWSISAEKMNEMYERWPSLKTFSFDTGMKYLTMKDRQRDKLLALQPKERVRQFYMVFQGLLPAKHSPVADKYIASYLALNVNTLRGIRNKLGF